MELARFAVPALIGMLLLGGYSVYVLNQYDSLAGNYNTLVAEYNHAKSTIQNQSNTISSLRNELNNSAEIYHNLLGNYTRTNIMFQSPLYNHSIEIWTLPQQVLPNRYVVWELLDTFDNHISISTNTTSNAMILDIFQFVNFASGQPYATIFNSTGTHFQYDEPVSEGCAVYVLVVRNLSNHPMNIIPNVTATYEYTPFLTGYCSL